MRGAPASAPRPRRRRGRLAALLLLLLAGGLGLWAWRAGWFAEPEAPPASVAVTRGTVEETVLASGTLKPSRLVAVGAQASGRVLKLHAALGEAVAQGELIAEIDSVTQENALATARAELADIRAQRAEVTAVLAQAEANLARQARMLAQNAVSRADYEAAEADVKTAQAQIEALEARISAAEIAVRTAEAELSYTRITAPIDGTVLAVVTQEGATVNAAQSAPTIVILGQLDVMTVRAEISEADIVEVRPGQPVWFTILGDPDTRYEAELEAIEPAPESIVDDSSLPDSASGASAGSEAIYYIALFDAPNPEGRLRTYMTAEVHVVLGRVEDALTAPAAALGARRPDGRREVQVLRPDGTVETRAVEIGLNDRVTAEIRSGLEAGDRVVLQGPGAGAMAASGGRRGPRMGGL